MEQPSTESLSKKVVRGGLWVFALRITSRSLGLDIVWHDAVYEGKDIVTGTWRWAGNSTNLGTLFLEKPLKFNWGERYCFCFSKSCKGSRRFTGRISETVPMNKAHKKLL